MEVVAKAQTLHHCPPFLTGSIVPRLRRPLPSSSRFACLAAKPVASRASLARPSFAVDTIVTSATSDDVEALFSQPAEDSPARRGGGKSASGASSVSSGVRLENIGKSFKGVTVLKDVNWEVKKGEKVGLVGVNGAGKTTQLRIIAGQDEPDSGNVIKAKTNMKIAFLSQEFEVCPSRTVKEEFASAFEEAMKVAEKLEKVQAALERSVEDLGMMGRLLDELDLLQRKAQAVDLDQVEVKISKMMPELGFSAAEDSDRLVASFSSGWQMRMSLGKILLQV